jgi:large subunit ribosomal protein L32
VVSKRDFLFFNKTKTTCFFCFRCFKLSCFKGVAMPVPKRKVSRARRDKKFANKGMEMTNVVACQTCQAPVLPHQLCWECGYYKGVKVTRTKVDRTHERVQARKTKEALVQAGGASKEESTDSK